MLASASIRQMVAEDTPLTLMPPQLQGKTKSYVANFGDHDYPIG